MRSRGVARVDTGFAAPARLGLFEGRRLAFVAFVRLVGRVSRRHRHFEIFERQLQLLDLALDLFRTRTKLLPLEFRDPDLEGLDQGLVGANRSLQPRGFRLLRDNHRLQHRRVVRKSFG